MQDNFEARIQRELVRSVRSDGTLSISNFIRNCRTSGDFSTAIRNLGYSESNWAFYRAGVWAYNNDIGRVRLRLGKSLRLTSLTGMTQTEAELLTSHMGTVVASAVDVVMLNSWSKESMLPTNVQVTGEEHLESLQKGGGFLLCCYQDHPAFATASRLVSSLEVTTIRPGAEKVESLILNGPCERWRQLDATPRSVRPMLKALEHGETIAIYGDYVPPGVSYAKAHMFCAPIKVSQSLVKIMLKSGRPIVPTAIFKRFDDQVVRVHVHFGLAKALAGSPKNLDDVNRCAILVGLLMEAIVRVNPPSWRLWGMLDKIWACDDPASPA